MDILENAEDLKVKMEKPKRVCAVPADSSKLGHEEFCRDCPDIREVARGSGTDFDNIIVPPGNVDYEDMQQFSKITVLWLQRRNRPHGGWTIFARYVNDGGSIAIIGQNVRRQSAWALSLQKHSGLSC